MPRSPSLCASCGRPLAPDVARCPGCEMSPAVWAPRTRPDGEIMLFVTLPITVLALGLLVGCLSFSPSLRQVLGWLGWLVPSYGLALAFFYGDARWQTASGAQATTFLGRVTWAEGAGQETIVHDAKGQEDIRGDEIHGRFRAHELPATLGANVVEIALVATFIGATARGRLRLEEARHIRWWRLAWLRRLRPPVRTGQITITVLSPPEDDDDRLTELLLGRSSPLSVSGYRDETSSVRARATSAEPRAFADVIREVFPPNERPGRWLRRVLGKHSGGVGSKKQALRRLVQIARDPASAAPWIAVRNALREAFAARHQPEKR